MGLAGKPGAIVLPATLAEGALVKGLVRSNAIDSKLTVKSQQDFAACMFRTEVSSQPFLVKRDTCIWQPTSKLTTMPELCPMFCRCCLCLAVLRQVLLSLCGSSGALLLEYFAVSSLIMSTCTQDRGLSSAACTGHLAEALLPPLLRLAVRVKVKLTILSACFMEG